MNSNFRVEKPGSRRSRVNLKSPDAGEAPSKFVAPAPPAALVPNPKTSPSLTEEQVEDVLRLFDLNPRYGPFIGINRIERWHRASRFGLDPPPLVRQLLDGDDAIPQRQSSSLW